MLALRKLYNRVAGTPQSAPLADLDQVRNAAGGYAFAITPLQRVERFLILGSEGGTFYASERVLTLENAANLAAVARSDGDAVLDLVIAVSEGGRAPKVSPALFALAVLAAVGSDSVRGRALGEGLRRVARTASHLLEFVAYVTTLRGWGRGLRSAVARWYAERPVRDLAYQVVKYGHRAGYSHRDVFRLVHPVATDERRAALYRWIVNGELPSTFGDDLALLEARAKALTSTEPDAAAWAAIVRDGHLPWSAIPSTWLREPAVWEALLPTLG